MYHVPYGYVIVFIVLDVIASIENLKNSIQNEMVNGLQVEIIRKINAIQN